MLSFSTFHPFAIWNGVTLAFAVLIFTSESGAILVGMGISSLFGDIRFILGTSCLSKCPQKLRMLKNINTSLDYKQEKTRYF